jgi:transposase
MHHKKRFTKDQFIAKARAVHGDSYDYSHTLYTDNSTPLRIHCRVPGHGPFWQSPGNHCRGNGCPACSDSRRVSKVIAAAAKRFLEKAKSVHGDFYGYDETVYTGGKSVVSIRCPRHGIFQQVAASHLNGRGCPTCDLEDEATVNNKRLEGFKDRAIAVYGSLYDYSKVEYVNLQTKVTIGCPIHGPFVRTPTQHLYGVGCPACGMKRDGNARKDGLEGFKAKAIACHGNVYDYSKVEYVNSRTKVTISCPIHGPFLKSPSQHIFGAGCPTCGIARRGRRVGIEDRHSSPPPVECPPASPPTKRRRSHLPANQDLSRPDRRTSPSGIAGKVRRVVLNDDQWAALEPLIEECRPQGRTEPIALRETIEAIVWRHQTGDKWRNVPSDLVPWWRAAQTFIRWSHLGVWERLLERVQERGLGLAFLDGTSIRAHHKAAEASKKGDLEHSAMCVRRLAALAAATVPRPA